VVDQYRTLTVYEPGRAGLENDGSTLLKGALSDPESKAKSVVSTEEGEKRSRELFAKHFSLKNWILPKQIASYKRRP